MGRPRNPSTSPERSAALQKAWIASNRERRTTQQRAWNAANFARIHDQDLRRKYGVDLAWYQTQLESQGGCCGICKSPVPGGRGRWHVDHCHATGRVRGLLCYRCNIMIGLARESPEIFLEAMAWVIRT